jgi:hypothetical protein
VLLSGRPSRASAAAWPRRPRHRRSSWPWAECRCGRPARLSSSGLATCTP